MAHSKIASIATYHKCIRQLDEFGYIRYQPSFHPAMGSLVYWPDSLGLSSSGSDPGFSCGLAKGRIASDYPQIGSDPGFIPD